ncbi:MAG TPA: SAM-dependent methyltransferase [Ktedonobacteraceae bacterium]|nr:SAM-dependent methyltransferase [Ktedonobacteraceae bacterium]
MSTEQLLIVTAQHEFADVAVTELRRLDEQLERVEDLAPGVILCSAPDVARFMQKAAQERTQLLFTRHLAPVQRIVHLSNSEQDIGAIAVAIAHLPGFALLERGTRFAVQTRFVQTDKSQGERPYSSGQLNKVLAEALAEETGAIESIKKPQVVISLLCTSRTGYLGISTVEENLSSWPGGARHFAQTPEQISRAEFKLLEALETFGVTLPSEGRALDLGAAPGGWTRLLLEAGVRVVAVDPANLDPRIAKRKHLDHYRGYAENYLEIALNKHYKFNIIVNDMRMDAREAARLLAKAAPCLRADGFVISVLKLPHAAPTINPLITLREALGILKAHYGIVQARQLFHNRQEVTLIAAQPLAGRA